MENCPFKKKKKTKNWQHQLKRELLQPIKRTTITKKISYAFVFIVLRCELEQLTQKTKRKNRLKTGWKL